MDPIHELDNHEEELKVHFYPELFLQRRIWILNILRKENITKVLDVGCGEGQLLTVLCQPAPWLLPPPSSVLPPPTPSSPDERVPPSPVFNEEEIPNLHITHLHGLDISPEDLAFAIEGSAPPKREKAEPKDTTYRSYRAGVQRWEETVAKVWKGGLEVVNEEFVDMECIVSTEVIEHLPPEIFPAFAPMLLGVYHPKFFLVTTPSYTYNARFTAPNAPPSARKGFPDPTKRTERIFRHDDHKFEWTREEFQTWCTETAKEWGYEVQETSIGRALDADIWGRDEELQGATSVAVFTRLEDVDGEERERRGRAVIEKLALAGSPHESLAVHHHMPNPASMKPQSLEEIAKCIKAKMEDYREGFMRLEELWFEEEVGIKCGGWIEMLVRAVEESPDLTLKNEVDGVKRGRNMWNIELVGVVNTNLWPTDSDKNVDYIPHDWTPGEGPYDSFDENESETDGSTTGASEGDVSGVNSGDEGDYESDGENKDWRKVPGWGTTKSEGKRPMTAQEEGSHWGGKTDWGGDSDTGGWGNVPQSGHSAMSSTAGWDGDEDESDNTTS
ncbi:hypothetical protein B0H34DRAFT_667022 [Crassisporium funariophilum]|nr:hypothetical protein B0H34DRAFT_667022 [Crassisporium funariophilum]